MKSLLMIGLVSLSFCGAFQTLLAGPATREAMRVKLDYARGTLEGLTLARFDVIVTNALQLRNLNQTNAYTLTGNPAYRQFSTNFLRNVDRLVDAARAENLERATVAYGEVTRGCIECHKVFRHEQFLKAQSQAR